MFFFAQGDYEASLGQYEKLIEKEPETADRVLFEMGIIMPIPKTAEKTIKRRWNASGKSLGIIRIVNSGATAR